MSKETIVIDGVEYAPVDGAAKALVHPGNEGFRERVTPKKPDENLFLYECKNCGGIHFRHAGYVPVMVPFIEGGGEKRMVLDESRVMVCVACKHSWIWVGKQMYEVTDRIDLQAWERTEKEAHAATGPGGNC